MGPHTRAHRPSSCRSPSPSISRVRQWVLLGPVCCPRPECCPRTGMLPSIRSADLDQECCPRYGVLPSVWSAALEPECCPRAGVLPSIRNAALDPERCPRSGTLPSIQNAALNPERCPQGRAGGAPRGMAPLGRRYGGVHWGNEDPAWLQRSPSQPFGRGPKPISQTPAQSTLFRQYRHQSGGSGRAHS